MNILVFDTETTSLDKPFCYNLGYVIADEEGHNLCTRDFVIEQVWHNMPLFNSAYYADKRPIYVARMRARQATLTKWGYACRQMAKDIKAFNVEKIYAFNKSFDEKVMAYNCEWYRNINPIELLSVYDIRKYCGEILESEEYKAFCLEHNLVLPSGNLATTAESFTRFIRDDNDFQEEHTALSDSIIEKELLFYIGLDKEEKSLKLRSSNLEQVLVVECDNVEITDNIYTFKYIKKTNSKAKGRLILK